MKSMYIKSASRGLYGFTLVEVAVVLLLLGVLVGISAPAFIDPIQRHNKNSFADQLRKDIAFSKDFAYLKSKTVVMCAEDFSTSERCDSEDWSMGWTIYQESSDTPPVIEDLKLVTPASEPARVVASTDTVRISTRGFITDASADLQPLTITTCVGDGDLSGEHVQLTVHASGHLERSVIPRASTAVCG